MRILGMAAMLASAIAMQACAQTCLVEAEAFADKGGWVVDPQFVEQMGSPYLLAHGKGVPVADAKTQVNVKPGRVRAYVRTRDWTPDWDGEKPGRFRLILGGRTFPNVLGVAPATWGWVDAGVVEVGEGPQTLALRDLTGFEGRCDAILLCPEDAPMPANDAAALRELRATMRGEAGAPTDVVKADFVVVGGGIAGTAAAIAAAEAGMDVAIVQDRPVLGGNASDEIRVRTERNRHEFHWIVKAIRNTRPNGNPMGNDDANRVELARSYPNLSLHLGWRAYGVVTNAERKIVAVDARNVETGARRRFVAPLYCDATGDGWLGYWAGAEFMYGREAKSEYGEMKCAQDRSDRLTMGNSLLWWTREREEPAAFPEVPWATKVSGGRAALAGSWQWEAGLHPDEDTIEDAEMLRDRLFRAIYGSFWTAKRDPKHSRRVLEWVPYIAGKRESRRIIGDYVVRESDVVQCRPFRDAIGIATWSIDLHWRKDDSGFFATTTHLMVKPWWMPYRSLCCRDVPNLFLAGRCASYTHVAFGSSRVMNAGGQQGVAAGFAASLCKKYGCMPRAIHEDKAKTKELQKLLNLKQAEKGMKEYQWPKPEPVVVEHAAVVLDNASAAGVEISGAWKTSRFNPERYGADYLHNVKASSEDLWVRYSPEITSNAVYSVFLFWNGDPDRSSAVPVEIVHAGGTVTNHVDMTCKSSAWNKIGEWPFAVGKPASVRILTVGMAGKTVVADAVKFAIVEELEPADDGEGDIRRGERERPKNPPAAAKEAVSPDGRNRITYSGGMVTVLRDNRTLFGPQPASLRLDRGEADVELCARNDGVAYRFRTDEDGEITVLDETAALVFPSPATELWVGYNWCDNPKNPKQDKLQHGCASAYMRTTPSSFVPDGRRIAYLPLTVRYPDGTAVLVTETDLRDYAGWHLRRNCGETRRLDGVFGKYPVREKERNVGANYRRVTVRHDWIVKTRGRRTFPWRVFAIADTPIGLVEQRITRELELSADFLGSGEWSVEIFRDADDADREPTHYVRETGRMKAGERLKVKLAPGGGFAARFTPAKPKRSTCAVGPERR